MRPDDEKRLKRISAREFPRSPNSSCASTIFSFPRSCVGFRPHGSIPISFIGTTKTYGSQFNSGSTKLLCVRASPRRYSIWRCIGSAWREIAFTRHHRIQTWSLWKFASDPSRWNRNRLRQSDDAVDRAGIWAYRSNPTEPSTVPLCQTILRQSRRRRRPRKGPEHLSQVPPGLALVRFVRPFRAGLRIASIVPTKRTRPFRIEALGRLSDCEFVLYFRVRVRSQILMSFGYNMLASGSIFPRLLAGTYPDMGLRRGFGRARRPL